MFSVFGGLWNSSAWELASVEDSLEWSKDFRIGIKITTFFIRLVSIILWSFSR